MTFIFNDGGRNTSKQRRRASARDCVARSIAIATGKPYDEVWNALTAGEQAHGPTTAKGRAKNADGGIVTKRKWFTQYMESLGFVWTPTMRIGSGCKVHLADGELPSGRLVVNVSRHFTAVIDGVIHDTSDPSRDGKRCVYGYWRLP